jgi:hypothetical protein
MLRVYANEDLEWRGNRLTTRDGGRRAPSVEIIPDTDWPRMYRIKLPDGSLTDMLNRARARDAARSILLAVLNGQETRSEGLPMRFGDKAAPETRRASRRSTGLAASKTQSVRHRRVA